MFASGDTVSIEYGLKSMMSKICRVCGTTHNLYGNHGVCKPCMHVGGGATTVINPKDINSYNITSYVNKADVKKVYPSLTDKQIEEVYAFSINNPAKGSMDNLIARRHSFEGTTMIITTVELEKPKPLIKDSALAHMLFGD